MTTITMKEFHFTKQHEILHNTEVEVKRSISVFSLRIEIWKVWNGFVLSPLTQCFVEPHFAAKAAASLGMSLPHLSISNVQHVCPFLQKLLNLSQNESWNLVSLNFDWAMFSVDILMKGELLQKSQFLWNHLLVFFQHQFVSNSIYLLVNSDQLPSPCIGKKSNLFVSFTSMAHPGDYVFMVMSIVCYSLHKVLHFCFKVYLTFFEFFSVSDELTVKAISLVFCKSYLPLAILTSSSDLQSVWKLVVLLTDSPPLELWICAAPSDFYGPLSCFFKM